MSIGLSKPTVGGSTDAWGTTLNTALDQLNAYITGWPKVADESVTSSTALQNDDILSVAVSANMVYNVTWGLKTDGATGGDIKYSWTGPASATFAWQSLGLDVALASLMPPISQDGAAIGTVITHGTLGSGTNSWITGSGTLTIAGTAGFLQLQWAQNASSGTATKVKVGSWLRADRIQ